tara:strand:+ start:1074 stop:1400 length:327 start_codon:yes stop_codon:yes gene_type:complete
MNNFELTLLITPENTKENTIKITKEFEKHLTDQGGKVLGKEECGLKNLAYKINGLKKAFYFFYQINIEGKNIQLLKKQLIQNEKIIRFLFIRIDKHVELPTKLIENTE